MHVPLLVPDVPFCDYLSLSYRAGHRLEIDEFLFTSYGLHIVPLDKHIRQYAIVEIKDKLKVMPILTIKENDYHTLVTIKGFGLSFLRKKPASFNALLMLLSEYPCNITRFDVAMDLAIDGADFLDSFKEKHPTGCISINRKSQRLEWITSKRSDGRDTGSVYAGKGTKSRCKLRIYDKAYQILCTKDVVISPLLRVEFQLGTEYGVSLHDVLSPESLFWHLASPAVLDKPADLTCPAWFKRETFRPGVLERSGRVDKIPLHVIKDLVSDSSFISDLVCYSDKNIGSDGRRLLINHITRYIESLPVALPTEPTD